MKQERIMNKVRKLYYWLRKWLLIKAAILGAPVFYFLISRRVAKRSPPNPLATEDKPRILVIPQLTRIGDLVCATPMFRLIKKHLPKSYLAIVVTNRTKDIIKNNPNIDEIIVFKSVDFFKRVLPEVRNLKFDWCFNIAATTVGTLVSFYGLIPNRVKITRWPKSFSEFLTDCLNNFKLRYFHHTYLPQYYLKMLEFIGIRDTEEIKQIFVSPEGEGKIAKWLMENGVKTRDMGHGTSDIVVGISIAAQNRIKEWGDEKFKEVAKYVNQKYGAKVIFLGIKKDEERIDKVLLDLSPLTASPGSVEIHRQDFLKAVNFNLEELPSLMKRLNLYIAVDTGPIYIAHALKVPLIDITGPCDPNEQPPNDAISLQVRPPAHIKSSSFVMKKAGRAEEHQKALKEILVEKVFLAVENLIGNLRYQKNHATTI